MIVLAVSLGLVGITHLAASYAGARARERYARIMGEYRRDRRDRLADSGSEMDEDLTFRSLDDQFTSLSDNTKDVWYEVRPYIGLWGCLFFSLILLRGAALLLAMGVGIWLLFG